MVRTELFLLSLSLQHKLETSNMGYKEAYYFPGWYFVDQKEYLVIWNLWWNPNANVLNFLNSTEKLELNPSKPVSKQDGLMV